MMWIISRILSSPRTPTNFMSKLRKCFKVSKIGNL
jgi:hypothetical protein